MSKTKQTETQQNVQQSQTSKEEVAVIRVKSGVRAGLRAVDPGC
jgi:hypothetical protein